MASLAPSKRNLLLYIIFAEGYVVLASELLAMRTLMPFIGSGIDVIAVIISAVLLPLAIGYHHGGRRYERQYQNSDKKRRSIRQILLRNILVSLTIFTLGLSYLTQEIFFLTLSGLGIKNYLLQAVIFCMLVLVYPVYLLAQTIPLLSHFFNSEHLSQVTGRMLFFSTIGSFGGSVFSTLVLMTTIGVHNTLMFTLFMLASVLFLLTKKRYLAYNSAALFLLGLAVTLNAPRVLETFNVVADTPYSLVKVYDQELSMEPGAPKKQWRIMQVNGSLSNYVFSSAYTEDGDTLPAHAYIEKHLLPPAGSRKGQPPLDILVLGAGGFALGMNDDENQYYFVDIDAELKPASEKHFLPKPLGPNKHFDPMSARAFLQRDNRTYDVIVLDLFTHVLSFPMEAVTREFLADIKSRLKPGGIVVANVIGSADYRDLFSVRYYNTFAHVFPHATRQVLGPYNAWTDAKNSATTLFLYFDRPHVGDRGVYSDDLNRYSLDH